MLHFASQKHCGNVVHCVHNHVLDIVTEIQHALPHVQLNGNNVQRSDGCQLIVCSQRGSVFLCTALFRNHKAFTSIATSTSRDLFPHDTFRSLGLLGTWHDTFAHVIVAIIMLPIGAVPVPVSGFVCVFFSMMVCLRHVCVQ